ncbi:MAG: hypothetical protein ACJ8ER_17020 [Allosphingosinicella sp.]
MSNVAIAPYASQGVDAGLELENLGLDEAAFFLLYLQRAATKSGVREYWRGTAFRGRSILREDHNGCFIVYVVETERDGSVRVTLLLAARAAAFPTPEAVDAILRPRLEDFFT